MKAVNFTNFTATDFTYPWDNVEYTFKAGQTTQIEDYKALHFCKHLVDRELYGNGKPLNDHSRSALENNCLGAVSEDKPQGIIESQVAISNALLTETPTEAPTPEPSEPAPFCTQCTSKGGRHLKICPTKNKDNFEEA